MNVKARSYYIGIAVTTVFLICFWSYYLPRHSLPSGMQESSRASRERSRSSDIRRAFIGRETSQQDIFKRGPEREHTGNGNREKNKTEEENDINIIKNGGKDSDKEDDREDLNYMKDEEDDFEIDAAVEEEERLGEMNKEMKVFGVEGEPPEKVTRLYEKPPSNLMRNSEPGGNERNGKRYLIYLCDKQVKCSGFADRQRAVVGLYLLSLATNRTFGLIMKVPASIKDFYVPNKVNWDINPDDLVGKSTIVLNCILKTHKCNFKDFNAFYPQDVVYVRSRNDFLHVLGRLGNYRENLPEWALGSQVVIFGHAWTTLMMPTHLLRNGVNTLLLQVASGMQQDAKIIPKIRKTTSCIKACEEILKQSKNQSQSIDKCVNVFDSLKNLDHLEKVIYLKHICPVETVLTPPPTDVIEAATGHDYVELELVCVQVRLGRSTTLKREPEINNIKDTIQIWNIVRPYISKGHHMFLASDSQEVRDQVKEIFGSRVHVSSDPIVHVNKVGKNQDGWLGMKTALTEQLVLSTSCKVLIFSQSGFSRRPAMVRHVLTRGKEGFKTYAFYNGRVKEMDLDRKQPVLPVRDD